MENLGPNGRASERPTGDRRDDGRRANSASEHGARRSKERERESQSFGTSCWLELTRVEERERCSSSLPTPISTLPLLSPFFTHQLSRPRSMQQAILRASARLSPAAIRPVAPILHCRPLSSSAPAAALPVRRPAASQRRRDPARILTIPRREERSERPPRNAATGEVIVEMPEDREGVLRPTHAATQLLGQPGLVITR